MKLLIRSPASRMRYLGQQLDSVHAQDSSGQTKLLAVRHGLADLANQLDQSAEPADPSLAQQDRFVVQVRVDGRWAQYCSNSLTQPEAEAKQQAGQQAHPGREFRIVRATTTFEVIA